MDHHGPNVWGRVYQEVDTSKIPSGICICPVSNLARHHLVSRNFDPVYLSSPRGGGDGDSCQKLTNPGVTHALFDSLKSLLYYGGFGNFQLK